MKSVRASRRSVLLLVPVLGLAAGASAAPVVWSSDQGGNGSTYDFVVDNTIIWDDAQVAAQAVGGHLAVITTPEEQNFVEALLDGQSAPTGSYWFGIHETPIEGLYTTVTGEVLTYTNWSDGEPNDGNAVENAAAVLWTADESAPLASRRGEWNDAPTSGYPVEGTADPIQSDVLRGGYLIEIAADDDDGTGGGDGGGTPPAAVPLPAAAYAFPAAAALVGVYGRRMKRRRD